LSSSYAPCRIKVAFASFSNAFVEEPASAGFVISKKPRESRNRFTVAAEMIDGESRTPVTIINISRRGLLASCNKPPSRGHYVEIRRGGTIIVGRVAWSGNQAFGVRSQDDIDFEKLTSIRSLSPEASKTSGEKIFPQLRKAKIPDPLTSYEQSRIRASRSTFLAGLFMASIGAAVVAALMHEVFANPISGIVEALSRRE
jgi:hypothetical protein